MKKLFSPAIALMNKLNYSKKFMVLWLVFLIAIGLVSYSLFEESSRIIYSSKQENVINKNDSLVYDILFPSIKMQINVRIERAIDKLYMSIGSILLLLLIAYYFFVGVYYAMKDNVQSLVHSARSFVDGNLRVHINLNTHDELGLVGDSFNNMTAGFQTLLADNKEIESRLRTNTDNALPVIFIKDVSGEYIFVNRMYEKLFHVENKKIQGKTDYDIFPKEWADAFSKIDQQVMHSGQTLEIEESAPQDDGIHLYHTIKFPLRKVSGEIYAVCGIATDITKRKKMEDELSIAAIAFQSQEAIVVTNPASVILRVNKAFTESTGYTEEEALGKKINILKSGLHNAAFYKAMWEHIQKTTAWQGEIWNKHKNGDISLKWLTITAVIGKEGKVTHYVGTHTDISERKRTEDALKASIAKFRSIVENSPISHLLCDQHYNITLLNNAFVQSLGYTQNEIPTLPDLWSKIYPISHDHQTELISLQIGLTHNKDERTAVEPLEISVLCKDSTIRTYRVSITVLDFDESFLGNYLFIFFDITERKQVQESLRILGERFHLSQSYGGIGIWENDLLNNHYYCSEVIMTLLELSDGQYNRENLQKIIHPEDLSREHKAYTDHLEQGKPYDIDYRIITSFGAESWVHSVSQVEYNADGKPVLVRGIMQDITDRKQIEITLLDFSNHIEMAREDERTLISREIHDELGGVLTALKINLSLLLNQIPSEMQSCHKRIAQMNDYLGTAIVSFRKILTDLRPDLLDHLGLLAAIEWKISEFTKQTGIQFVLTIPENDIVMEEKRNIAVFRIMQEALNNIHQHAKATQVIFDIEMNEKGLKMEITDNGCGMITTEKIHQAGKYGILGMQERARHFGGKVIITSYSNKGTTLSLEMPIEVMPKRRFYD